MSLRMSRLMGEAEDSGSRARSDAVGEPGGGTGQVGTPWPGRMPSFRIPASNAYLFRKSATPFLTYWANRSRREPPRV